MGKTVLITGSAQGLGYKTAELLKSQGHNVILSDIDPDKLHQAKTTLGCDGALLDVTNQSQIENVISQIKQQHGNLEVLINNAGVMIEGAIGAISEESIDRALDINLKGSILCTREFIRQTDTGTIIIINSVSGLMAKANRSVYHATKWGLTGFAKAMQDELKGSGFRIMSIHPGLIDTNLFDNAGVDRKMENALDPNDVAGLTSYMINLPQHVYLPNVTMSHTSY